MADNQSKQLVDEVHTVPVIVRLLGRQAPSLSGRYGDPVSKDVAQRLAAIAQYKLRRCLREGGACFQLHVLLLICHFREGCSIELEYEQLAASSGTGRERALLGLVYGQLLISCKCRDAVQHLRKGFSLAVDFLDSSDYFCLVRQHELLDYLPVLPKPSPPFKLEALLTEAGVIKRLQEDTGRRYDNTHHDTVG
ncbi:MAG: hypothetical protein BMS9Abin08_1561 [Gammaproteobacteria bacterium]|nr:MAG: hypothetical protein BMS9Abin08_1561 [Gammaproteobacteria bacterium]